MRFNPDHKNLQWIVNNPSLMKMVKIDDIRATIIVDGKRVLKKIEDTPHYAFVKGDPDPYYQYADTAGELAGFGKEHSLNVFLNLKQKWNNRRYATNKDEFIEVRSDPMGEYYVILDGVHRAALLANDGFTEIPVMVKQYHPLGPLEQFDQYLADFENTFKEWYTPIYFDEDRIIHERTYPNWVVRKNFLTNKERGQAKWDYILKKNMPKGMSSRSVLDIGCNVGLFAMNMSEMGAHVVGVDRGEGVVQPTNTGLGSESVVQQAYFVHNLFVLYNKKQYKVDYIERDLAVEGLADIMDTYNIDTVTSFCVLYHFGRERMIELLEEVSRARTIILQANHGHGGPLGIMANADTHVGILRHFGYNTEIKWGYDVDTTYKYPLIIGRK